MTAPPIPLVVLCRRVDGADGGEPNWYHTCDHHNYKRWPTEEWAVQEELIVLADGRNHPTARLEFPPIRQERFQPTRHA